MDLNQQKAQFSLAYVHAVSAVAGAKLFRCDVDDESVDITLGQTGGDGTVRSPRLDIQLKCTEQDILRADGVHFPLKRKNYDDLRAVDFMVPKVLVVLMVPDNLAAWVTPTPEERLCLHRFAWWMNLAGADERADVDTPTVILPRGQLFHVDALRDMLTKVGRKERL